MAFLNYPRLSKKYLTKQLLPDWTKMILRRIYFYYRSIRPDYASEINFWDHALSVERKQKWITELIEPNTRANIFPRLLLSHLKELKRGGSEHIKVLDVGCGPLSRLAWGAEQNLFDLVAVDPLAKEYNALLKKYKISFPIKAIKGTGESLLKTFSKESFDIVYSGNALDHARNVKKCVNSIYKILKKNGFLFLEGFIKEGTHSHWQGLHQHDLTIEDGELIRYNRKGYKTNITADLGFLCVHQEQAGKKAGDWYKIILKKTL